ncbi:MAG: hypothetical protein NTV46_03315 [Verrucomicrobia bacterium]|nr:hypothetical protein [Verrucomicrobiota bacterium]
MPATAAPSVTAPKPPVPATAAPSVTAPKPPVPATAGTTAVPRLAAPQASISQEKTASSKSEIKARAVMVERAMTYGDFAVQHGTDTRRLNELNGLDLTKATPLIKGAELYVPGKP